MRIVLVFAAAWFGLALGATEGEDCCHCEHASHAGLEASRAHDATDAPSTESPVDHDDSEGCPADCPNPCCSASASSGAPVNAATCVTSPEHVAAVTHHGVATGLAPRTGRRHGVYRPPRA